MNPAGQVDAGGGAVEIESAAREAEGGAVDDVRRKDVRFVEARDLFAEEDIDERERIVCGGISLAVVDGVDDGQGILVRESVVQAAAAEILANVLHGIGECLGDAARAAGESQKLGSVGHGP